MVDYLRARELVRALMLLPEGFEGYKTVKLEDMPKVPETFEFLRLAREVVFSLRVHDFLVVDFFLKPRQRQKKSPMHQDRFTGGGSFLRADLDVAGGAGGTSHALGLGVRQ